MVGIACTYPNCDTTFSSIAAQQRHIKTVHEDTRAMPCPHCPRRFRDRFNLRIHLRTHPGADPDDTILSHSSPYALVSALPDLQTPIDPTHDEVVDQDRPHGDCKQELGYVEEPVQAYRKRPNSEARCHMCEVNVRMREFYGHMKWHAEELEKESRKLGETLEAYKRCCTAAEYVFKDS